MVQSLICQTSDEKRKNNRDICVVNVMQYSKKEIRKLMNQKRLTLNSEDVEKAGEGIASILSNSGMIKHETLFLSFASYKNEPDTDVIFKYLKSKYYQVTFAYPRVCDDRKSMFFYTVDSLKELKPGYMGIREPEDNTKKKILLSNSLSHQLFDPVSNAKRYSNVVILMPGLAFDLNGSRIGYGGGFYDRYLSGLKCEDNNGVKNFIKIGLGYDFQILINDTAEFEEHDISLDYIVTGNNMYDCIKFRSGGVK